MHIMVLTGTAGMPVQLQKGLREQDRVARVSVDDEGWAGRIDQETEVVILTCCGTEPEQQVRAVKSNQQPAPLFVGFVRFPDAEAIDSLLEAGCREVLTPDDNLPARWKVIESLVRQSPSPGRSLRQKLGPILLNTTELIVTVLDLDGRILLLNEATEERFGYAEGDVKGKPVWDVFVPEEQHAEVADVFGDLLQRAGANQHENEWVTRDGERRQIAWSNNVLTDEEGDPEYVVATGVDVTHVRSVEYELRETNARYRAILETSVDAIITIDRAGVIQSFNPAAEEMFGYESREVIGEKVNVLMPQPYRDEHDDYMERYYETGERRIIGIGRDVTGLRSDGTTFPIRLAVSEAKVEGEMFFTGIIQDLTDERRMQREILDTLEEQRRRIGHELHDGLGSMLSGMRLIVESLISRLESEGSIQKDQLQKLVGYIAEADEVARTLSRGLTPPEMAGDTFAAAIRRLGRRSEELFDLNVEVTIAEQLNPLDDATGTHIYRIIQEAVRNAAAHGNADEVEITIRQVDGRVELEIIDDGSGLPEGFDPHDVEGIGLHTMRYRANLCGGWLEIDSPDDVGVRVRCTLPLVDSASVQE